MGPSDVECFRGKIEASPYWVAPWYVVPSDKADEFARACDIDYTGLWTYEHD